jgi:hypothetical protein
MSLSHPRNSSGTPISSEAADPVDFCHQIHESSSLRHEYFLDYLGPVIIWMPEKSREFCFEGMDKPVCGGGRYWGGPFVLLVPVAPSPTRTGLWKSKLYHPNLVQNRTMFGAIQINSYHPRTGCIGNAVSAQLLARTCERMGE